MTPPHHHDHGAAHHHVRHVYGRLAPGYDRSMRFADRALGFTAGRLWAASGAVGRVLEIGVGTGRNLDHYPASTRVVGADLSRGMLEQARGRAAARRGGAVALVEADAAWLPFGDASFDAVVSTLTMCTYPDPVAAMREALRVLVPGGELRCMEHGEPRGRLLHSLLGALQPLAFRIEADHLLRNPARILTDAGAELLSVRRFRRGAVWRVLARRPPG